jgi:hypothetical protein
MHTLAVYLLWLSVVWNEPHKGGMLEVYENGGYTQIWYEEQDMIRFGISPAVALEKYNSLKDLETYYLEQCEKLGWAVDRDWLTYLWEVRICYWHAYKAMDRSEPLVIRLSAIHNLKNALGRFSIGDPVHWFDRGWLPASY